MTDNSAASQPVKLFNKDFFLLWQGQFVSQLGNQVHSIAMMFWIKHATGSATLMGMVMMFSMLPGVILGPIGGTIADNYSRRKIIIVSDLLCGICVLSLAVLLFYSPENISLATVWLFVVAVVVGIISAFFRPAISAAIPDLVPRDKIGAANSMNQSSVQVSSLLGLGTGGVLFRILGAPFLFFIDGLTYLFSAFSESFIRIRQVIPDKGSGFKEVMVKFRNDTLDGFRYVWQRKGMRNLFFAATFINFFVAPFAVLMPFYVEDHLKTTPDWYGFIMALVGIGALIGYALIGILRISGRQRSNIIIVSLILFGMVIGSLGLTDVIAFSMVLVLMVGLLAGAININIMTILQLTTPSEIRGRVFGLLGTISSGLFPIGMGLSGVIAELTGNNIPVIYVFSGIITTLLAIIVSFSRDFREFLAFEPEREASDSHKGE